MMIDLKKYLDKLEDMNCYRTYGEIKKIIGSSIESSGPRAEIGEICRIVKKNSSPDSYILAEVVGFNDKRILLMPYEDTKGINNGDRVYATGQQLQVKVNEKLIGKVLDGLGRPVDGTDIGACELRDAYADSPNPFTRKRISEPLPLGIKAIDSLLTCGKGQRLGIFSGTGVGKSTLLGMIARNSSADINVIALVGERGREVNDFIEKDLNEEGLKRSIVIVATSDQPAIIRIKCALVATAIAEYFRDRKKNVLLMMDSLTRFAMAQREVGLAAGEPPVARGYTPSVLSVLPRLLERTGYNDECCITAIYTVLVEGDEMNEPISDTVRGILDGHIILSRAIAAKNHYPAIDILNSISRVMPDIIDQKHLQSAMQVRNLLSTYENYRDLISIGAYKEGSNKEIDKALKNIDNINGFLKQNVKDSVLYKDTLSTLENLVI
ncbi:MAG: flagellar protein export ATPase FliI [Clostridia bacterium]